jgi:hypothetical protein
MMKRHSVVLALLGLAAVLGGCASVDVKRVTSVEQPGIRYWRPEPFLALQRTKEGKCDVSTLTLPDKSEEYAITVNAGLGAAKASPTLHDGWRLDSLSTDIDSKTAENLTAIASLVKSIAPSGLIGRAAAPGGNTPDPCSGIYRVNYDNSGRIQSFSKVRII